MTKKQDYIKWILAVISGEERAKVEGEMQRFTDDDWAEIVNIAFRQGVSPVLYYKLKQSGMSDKVLASAYGKLRIQYRDTLNKNMRRYYALKKVLECLQLAGIPVIVLKGAYLAEHIYDNIGLRPMADIDLMVHRYDSEIVCNVLETMKYIPGESNANEIRHTYTNEIHYYHPEGLVAIDLHFKLDQEASPFSVDPEGLWQRAQPTTTLGLNTLTLSTEDHFIYLCYHTAFRHMFYELKHLIDVYYYLLKFNERIEWEKVVDIASKWGLQRNIVLTTDILEHMLKVTISPPLASLMETEHFRSRAVSWAEELILAEEGAFFLKFKTLANLINLPGLSDKIGYLWRGMTFIPRGEEKASAHLLIFLYCSRLYFIGKRYFELFIISFLRSHKGWFFLRIMHWLKK
jgi:hypothetical protein